MMGDSEEYGIGDHRGRDFPICPECESDVLVSARSADERFTCHACDIVFAEEESHVPQADSAAECPCCGAAPGTVYRCQACGADLVERAGGEQA